jgi:hypothetical protein
MSWDDASKPESTRETSALNCSESGASDETAVVAEASEAAMVRWKTDSCSRIDFFVFVSSMVNVLSLIVGLILGDNHQKRETMSPPRGPRTCRTRQIPKISQTFP